MANAFFLNATPHVIAVNLNTSLQNQILAPEMSVAAEVSAAAESAVLTAWKAPIAKDPHQGEFGGNNGQNLMLVISEGSSSYMVWDIHSTVSIALNLYFYILGDQVVGMDQTGWTGGIRVSSAGKVVATRLFMRAPPAAF